MRKRLVLLGAGSVAEHQLVPLVEQSGRRAGSERGQQRGSHERRRLQALSDVVPQRVLYLRRLPHAHDDQLPVLQAHQHVALLLGDGDAAHGDAHGHGLCAQRQAAWGEDEVSSCTEVVSVKNRCGRVTCKGHGWTGIPARCR